MQILYTSDTHVYPPYFERLLAAAQKIHPHAVIVGGDIVPDWKGGIQASIKPHKAWVSDRLLPLLRDFRVASDNLPVLVDLGNDDIAAARFLLEEQDGHDLHLLHMSVVKLSHRLAVVGYMKVNPTPFRIKDGEKADCRDHSGLSESGVTAKGSVTFTGTETPHVIDPAHGTIEDDLDELSKVLESNTWQDYSFLFVSHAPPKNTDLDRTSAGHNVGSLAVKRFIEKWAATDRLVATLHGHIHESPWQTGRVWQYIEGVPCFNVGQRVKTLRALLFDTEDVTQSARLVSIESAGELTVMDKDEWFPERVDM